MKQAVAIREKFPGYKGADLSETVLDYCRLLDKWGRPVEEADLRRKYKIKEEDKDKDKT